MADDFYTWQDLLDDESHDARQEPMVDSSATEAPQAISLEDLISEGQIPSELSDLLKQRDELEKDFKALTGQAKPEPEDERTKLMYPVFAHTKETRLQEKRLRSRDERRMAAQKKRFEAKLIERKRLKAQAVEQEVKEREKRALKNHKRRIEILEAESEKRRRERALMEAQRQAKWHSLQEDTLRRSRLEASRQARWQCERDEAARIHSQKTVAQRRAEERERNNHLDNRRAEASRMRAAVILEQRRQAKAEEDKRIKAEERRRFG